jgi:WD40 repeat protein/tRNA A-37 threonylcarbamoyl transferase component Bud32
MSEATTLTERDERFGEVVFAYLRAREAGNRIDRQVWLARFPEFAPELTDFFADQEEVDRLGAPLREIARAAERPSTDGPGATVPRGTPALPGPLPLTFADYALLEELGRGGMGVVYKARQTTLHRVVALKMILAGHFASADEVQRFRREAEAAASLDHPYIVPIYHVGEHGGRPYFTMKLIEGGSLAAARGAATWSAAPRAAAQLLAKVARAVHHAHQRGVLHRDLKPANILLDGQGEPHVTDFGLARRLTDDATLTRSGAVVGTPAYMAPEQALPTPGGVSTAADVYGLGAVLYFLLAGRPPFHGPTPLDVVAQVRGQAPAPPRRTQPEVPRDLETVCLKCLHKDPQRRYPDAAALADDLQRFLDQKPILARPAGVTERLARWARRRPFAVALIAVSLLALLGALAGMAWHTVRIAEALSAVREREREVRQHLYVADVHLAHDFFWKNGDVGGMWAQLQRHIPGPDDDDNRGFAWYYLEHLSRKSDAQALRGHTGDVFSVTYAPDGRTVASAGADGTVRLWDPVALVARGVWHAHEGAIRAVAFAPDGRLLATAGDDGAVRLWDAADGTRCGGCVGHGGGALCLAFSPDGQRLVSGGRDRHVRVWAVATGRELADNSCDHEVSGVVFHPGGDRVSYRPAGSGYIGLWAPGAAAPVRAWAVPGPEALCFALTPTADQVLVGYSDGRVVSYQPGNEGAIRPFPGPSRPVRALSVSPDRRFVAAGCDDATVRVWDPWGEVPDYVGKGHRGPVWAVAFAPDGSRLASAGADGTLRFWDWTASQDYDALRPAVVAARRVAFAADGRTMALACADHTVRILDPVTWQERSRLQDAAGEVRALALSADGATAATWEATRLLRLWDARTGRSEATFPALEFIYCLAFSPDGRLLAEGCGHGALHLRSRSDGAVRVACALPAAVRAIAFSPDGSTLAAAAGGTLLLWDVAANKERARLSCAEIRSLAFTHDSRTVITYGTDHRLHFWSVAHPGSPLVIDSAANAAPGANLAVSPDDQLVAVANETQVHLFDLKTRAISRRLSMAAGTIEGLGFGPDGNRIVGMTAAGRVFGWNLKTFTMDSPAGSVLGGVHSLAFLPGSGTLLTGSGDRPADTTHYYTLLGLNGNHRSLVEGNTSAAVRLWDPVSGRQRGTLPPPAGVRLHCLALAPDGRTAAGGCSGGLVRLWDLATGRERLTLFTNEADKGRWRLIDEGRRAGIPGQAELQSAVRAIAFSPDGRLLVTANDDGHIRLWDPTSGEVRQTWCTDHAGTICLAFSPDGATLAVNRGAAVELWDVAGGRVRRTLEGHTTAVRALAWSADGSLLASGGEDRLVKLWDPGTGRERATLVGHQGLVTALAFSPDGRTLASGGHDQRVQLWHIATGQELFALTTTFKVAAVAFAPDGRTLAGAGEEPTASGSVFLWRAPRLPGRPTP